MASTEHVPLAEWLDQNVPGWRGFTAETLRMELRHRFEAGEFRRLRVHTRNSPLEAVKVGDTYFAELLPRTK